MSDSILGVEMSPFIDETVKEKCDAQEELSEPTGEYQDVPENETLGIDAEMQAIADIFIAFDAKFEKSYQETRQALKNVDEKLAAIDQKLTSIEMAAKNVNLSDVTNKLVLIETAVTDKAANLADIGNELVSIDEAVKNVNLSEVSGKLAAIETIVKNYELLEVNNKITSLDTMVNDKFKAIMANIKEINDGQHKNLDKWFQIGAIVITAILTYIIATLIK